MRLRMLKTMAGPNAVARAGDLYDPKDHKEAQRLIDAHCAVPEPESVKRIIAVPPSTALVEANENAMLPSSTPRKAARHGGDAA